MLKVSQKTRTGKQNNGSRAVIAGFFVFVVGTVRSTTRPEEEGEAWGIESAISLPDATKSFILDL